MSDAFFCNAIRAAASARALSLRSITALILAISDSWVDFATALSSVNSTEDSIRRYCKEKLYLNERLLKVLEAN